MRLLKIEQLCEPGSGVVNEDAAGYNDYAAWVVDGATGLSGRTLTEAPTDPHWYAQWWHQHLHRHLTDQPDLSKFCLDSIDLVAEHYLAQWPDATPHDYPSAAAAIVRFCHDHLEYQLFGDAVLLLRDRQGLQVIRDTRLNRLDDLVLSQMNRLINFEQHSHSVARHKLLPQLRAHRQLKNTMDGYWTLEFDRAAALHGLQGQYQPEGELEVLLLTDGLSILLDTFQYCSAEELISWVAEEGLRPLYQQVRTLEQADPKMEEFTRFKVSDDASGLYFVAV